MATKNKRVAGYLQDHIYERFEGYTQSQKISESKAISLILEEYFGLKPVTSELQQDLVERVEFVEQRLERWASWATRVDKKMGV